MLALFTFYPVTTAATLICLLSLALGGFAERRGAVMILIAVYGTLAAQTVTHESIPLVPLLAIDFILACGFLWLALKYSSLWLGLAMLAQAAELGLHAMFLSDESPGHGVHVLVLTLVSWLLLAFLFVGTLSSWRRRVRASGSGKSLAA